MCTLILLVSFSENEMCAQATTAHAIGDTFFRYTARLDKSLESFEDVNLQMLQFPCSDKLAVVSSNMNGTDYELVKPAYREFYDIEGTTLYLKGIQGPDPFLGKPLSILFFNEGIPMVRSNRKDDFYARTTNSFVLVYNQKDLKGGLKEWAIDQEIQSIRINGKLKTISSYKTQEQFNNYFAILDGYVIEHNWEYAVETIDVKRETWRQTETEEYLFLSPYFSPIENSFLSFYPFDNMKEAARIISSPYNGFHFNIHQPIGRHIECDYSKTMVYIFPNPTFGPVKARFSNGAQGSYSFIISNIIGKRMWEKELYVGGQNQELDIELPSFSKGVYIYKIVDNNGNVIQSRRLVIVDP